MSGSGVLQLHCTVFFVINNLYPAAPSFSTDGQNTFPAKLFMNTATEQSETGRDQRTVVVLGTARSGTSVTAGVLETLGVDMGSASYPTESNPRGAFEDDDFAKLHKAILNSAEEGKTYFDPPAPERVLAQRDKFDRRIQNLILEKSRGKSLWGWKHPDTIMMAELYLPYLVNPHFILVFRNPLGIAHSTVGHTRRFKDKVDLWRALKLVDFYYGEILRFMDRHPDLPKVLLSFEDLVRNPVKEAGMLAEFLGIEFTEKKMRKVERMVIPRERITVEKIRANGLLTGKIPRLVKKKLLPLLRANNKVES